MLPLIMFTNKQKCVLSTTFTDILLIIHFDNNYKIYNVTKKL